MAPNVAIIQGTSSGIGAQVARQYLARTNLQIVALSRDATRAKQAILSSSYRGGPDSSSLDQSRLHTLSVDALDESTLQKAADDIKSRFGPHCLKTLWNVGGILRPEKNLQQVSLQSLNESFAVNAFAHLLSAKHFVPLIPRGAEKKKVQEQHNGDDAANGLIHRDLSVVAHLSARVGSIGDNGKGGWYSYRSSKAALNQMVKTLSHELSLRSVPAISVALHPGTVRSHLSKDFTGGPDSDKPLDKAKGQFEPWEAAENLVNVVASLGKDDNGSFRDWKNEKVPW
ncbi:uncharacterized protein PFL1_00664 [Pseudozyma flocculosa PF-1]|uniref:Related to short chain dehydrogenase n=1 Tax=Pseudozyma flocculosa TaxID=84751 RepID=A0A5C3EU50_9BASI|nr:uncharacterized protein PFL1_00664 [Pseudozyma flocculosa PF-1]EPQ32469.1 hypothetical protein PFL1_00664 [Pseudozyma flocculosa PF-1]SPO34541.1 related to short chain dehydrogenase [Pseudozyma flocculosa]